MISNIKYISIVILTSILLTACNSGKDNKASTEQATSVPQIGDHVPNNEVCMVTNTYMGAAQTAVSFEGKIYYASCELCQKRIPKEKATRTSIDLYTLKGVDKADAYIVLVGDHGEVAYFENEQSYKALIAKGNMHQK